MPAETITISTASVSPSLNSRPSTPSLAEHLLGALVEMHLDAQASIFCDQHPRAGVVDLPRHQPRGELDDVRFQAQVVGRLGGFQAEQAAADHRAALDVAWRRR